MFLLWISFSRWSSNVLRKQIRIVYQLCLFSYLELIVTTSYPSCLRLWPTCCHDTLGIFECTNWKHSLNSILQNPSFQPLHWLCGMACNILKAGAQCSQDSSNYFPHLGTSLLRLKDLMNFNCKVQMALFCQLRTFFLLNQILDFIGWLRMSAGWSHHQKAVSSCFRLLDV